MKTANFMYYLSFINTKIGRRRVGTKSLLSITTISTEMKKSRSKRRSAVRASLKTFVQVILPTARPK
jgi:hypothetical protein